MQGRRNLHDAVCFIHEVVGKFGIVDAFLARRTYTARKKLRIVWKIRLIPIEPDIGNKNVVNLYGHTPYAYCI